MALGISLDSLVTSKVGIRKLPICLPLFLLLSAWLIRLSIQPRSLDESKRARQPFLTQPLICTETPCIVAFCPGLLRLLYLLWLNETAFNCLIKNPLPFICHCHTISVNLVYWGRQGWEAKIIPICTCGILNTLILLCNICNILKEYAQPKCKPAAKWPRVNPV